MIIATEIGRNLWRMRPFCSYRQQLKQFKNPYIGQRQPSCSHPFRIVSGTILRKDGRTHAYPDPTSPAACGDPRSSLSVSARSSPDGSEACLPEGVLGRSVDRGILDTLLRVDAGDEFFRGASSLRTVPAGPRSCIVISRWINQWPHRYPSRIAGPCRRAGGRDGGRTGPR